MSKALQWAAVAGLGCLGLMMLAGSVPVIGLAVLGAAGYRAYQITRPTRVV